MSPDFTHEGEQSMSPWYQSLHPVHHSSSRSATAGPGMVTPVTTRVSWQIPQHPNPSLSREQEEGLMFASDNICMLCKGSVLMLLSSLLSIFHLLCAHNESLLLWFCTSIPSKTCHGQNISVTVQFPLGNRQTYSRTCCIKGCAFPFQGTSSWLWLHVIHILSPSCI